MTDWDKMMWAYRAVFTQTNAGGGNIIANVIATCRTEILYGLLGADDYAANRELSVYGTDSAGNVIARLMYPTSLDNVRLPIISSKESAITDNAGAQLEKRYIMGYGDILKLQASSLAQDETFTVTIRALIDAQKPNIATTGSTGTVTTTTTYDKVI